MQRQRRKSRDSEHAKQCASCSKYTAWQDDLVTSVGDRVGTVWPGVSVVMPVLNEERHLEVAVRRVLAQDYPGELEVILAVGPSRDGTREIADALAAGPRWSR